MKAKLLIDFSFYDVYCTYIYVPFSNEPNRTYQLPKFITHAALRPIEFNELYVKEPDMPKWCFKYPNCLLAIALSLSIQNLLSLKSIILGTDLSRDFFIFESVHIHLSSFKSPPPLSACVCLMWAHSIQSHFFNQLTLSWSCSSHSLTLSLCTSLLRNSSLGETCWIIEPFLSGETLCTFSSE